jgi:steroid 5-alpha reductase family enzyme
MPSAVAAAMGILLVVFSSSLSPVEANSLLLCEPRRRVSTSFLFLPKLTAKTYSSGLKRQQQQQHQKIITLQNNPSWNLIPRGGQQQSPHSPKTYSTALFDGSSMLSAAAATTTTTTSSPFLQYNIVIFLVNLLGMIISLVFPGMQYHLDLLGTGSFAIASSYMLLINGVNNNSSLLRVQVVSSIAVIIWATKLAAFLFYRALNVKEDARLESTLSTKSGVVFFWLISFFWGVISSLPHSLGLASSLDAGDNINNTIGLYSGTIIYTVGLFMESIADFQKWTWKQSNPGKFCRTGLWSISQHPNFAGNIMIWTGIAIINLPSLAWQLVPIACLSPLILWNFFLGQAQGSITSGVELATKKYGADPDYSNYVATVPLLFPDITRLRGKHE